MVRCQARSRRTSSWSAREAAIQRALMYASEVPLQTAEACARVAELDEKLAALGPVNLVADDEYRELDERLGFLRAQHEGR